MGDPTRRRCTLSYKTRIRRVKTYVGDSFHRTYKHVLLAAREAPSLLRSIPSSSQFFEFIFKLLRVACEHCKGKGGDLAEATSQTCARPDRPKDRLQERSEDGLGGPFSLYIWYL